MNEDDVGKGAARLLNRGLENIEQDTLNRLQSARRATVKNYHTAGTRLSTGQGTSALSGHGWHLKTGKRLSVFALLFAIGGILYLHALQQGYENEEIDIMLLVDDLPIDAYLDNELDTW